jgi:hypothetical protein
MRNDGLRFLCETVTCEVVSTTSVLTSGSHAGREAGAADQPLRGELHLRRGDACRSSSQNGQIVLRYVRQPERLDRIGRRRSQPRRQRGRAHAASRASDGSTAWFLGRAGTARAFVDAAAQLAPARFERCLGRGPAMHACTAEHIRRDTDLSPGGVADALSLAVLGRRRDEGSLELGEIDSSPRRPLLRACRVFRCWSK